MSGQPGQRAARIIALAHKAGAIHADALAVSDSGDSISVRNGLVESVERADAQGIGLRAFVETRQGLAFATASTSDLSDAGLQQLAGQVVAMARISEPDPDAVPPVGAAHPDEAEICAWEKQHPDQDSGWNIEAAKAAALECETIAREFSDKITNSEGAEAAFGLSHVAYASSDDFRAEYCKSSASLSLSVIAGSGENMRRDYAWHRALTASDLRSPQRLGEEAASRAINSLDASATASGEASIVFEPRTASSLLRHLTAAINGRAVLQQRTFLADCEGVSVFPDFVTIVDDPNHADGLGNRLFDGEGTRCAARPIIESGRLTGFLTDRYAAGRLGRPATGNARRGLTGDISIGPANVIWQPGEPDQAAMLREIDSGLLITELIGFGVNAVTGDYSRGAAGFLIENGKIARPVQGFTIAGNLKEMFANIICVGSDLAWFGSSATPSIAISGMTVAGR
jgi:PmbA protein